MKCIKCHGRISAQDIDNKKTLCARLGKAYDGPPKVCFECVMVTIVGWDFGEAPPNEGGDT